jgi:hypothetical protein
MMDRINALIMNVWSRGFELRREEGQGTVEYVLIVAALVTFVGAIIGVLSGDLTKFVNGITL